MSTEITVQNNGGNATACGLKYFAVTAMLIDHIAWCFVDTYSALGAVMHLIGRMTAPIMTYLLTEGFYYTRNIKKYQARLGIFALLSWLPYIFMETGGLPLREKAEGGYMFLPYQSVIYTFFMTLTVLRTVHSKKLNKAVKCVSVLLLCGCTLTADWYFFPIIWALLFDRYRGDFKKQAIAFAVSSVIIQTVFISVLFNGAFTENMFQYGVILALIPLSRYGGERGNIFGKADKWFFYVFYPLHMMVLAFIRLWVFGI